MRIGSVQVGVLLVASLLGGATSLSAQTAPQWTQSLITLTQIFDPATVFTPLQPLLEKFELVFTAIAFTVVLIATVLRVARARTGDESMGWVASTMAIVAFMALTSSLSTSNFSLNRKIFDAGDAVTGWSGYDKFNIIRTAWYTMLLSTPPTSPAGDVLDTGQQVLAPTPETPTPAQRLESWKVGAWKAIKKTVGGNFAAQKSAETSLTLFIMLIIPTLTLLLAILLILMGEFLRAMLFYCMGIFVPFMIGLLAFGPTRGAATSFLTKYVTVALWSVAWALGNEICLSLLTVATNWIVNSCQAVVASATATSAATTPLGFGTSGLLVAAAPHMAWGLLFVIVMLVMFVAVLLIGSVFLAPYAFSAMIAKGSSFAGGVLSGGVGPAAASGANASEGGGLVIRGAAAKGAAGAGKSMAALAGRIGLAMSGAASSMEGVSERGGILGGIAGLGQKLFLGSAGPMGSAGAAGPGTALAMAEAERPNRPGPRVASSMMNTFSAGGGPVSRIGTEAARSMGNATGAGASPGARSMLERAK
jgi:hypothetical protein